MAQLEFQREPRLAVDCAPIIACYFASLLGRAATAWAREAGERFVPALRPFVTQAVEARPSLGAADADVGRDAVRQALPLSFAHAVGHAVAMRTDERTQAFYSGLSLGREFIMPTAQGAFRASEDIESFAGFTHTARDNDAFVGIHLPGFFVPEAAVVHDAHLRRQTQAIFAVLTGLEPGQRALVGTGVRIALPDGFAAFIVPRSGLATKHGITIVNSPGTVDAGYRGEIKVTLLNTDTEHAFDIAVGDRIAQMIVMPVTRAQFLPVEELPDSVRGEGGFGSTGYQTTTGTGI